MALAEVCASNEMLKGWVTPTSTAGGASAARKASKSAGGSRAWASALQDASSMAGCAFWQPLRSNTQHLGLNSRAALDF